MAVLGLLWVDPARLGGKVEAVDDPTADWLELMRDPERGRVVATNTFGAANTKLGCGWCTGFGVPAAELTLLDTELEELEAVAVESANRVMLSDLARCRSTAGRLLAGMLSDTVRFAPMDRASCKDESLSCSGGGSAVAAFGPHSALGHAEELVDMVFLFLGAAPAAASAAPAATVLVEGLDVFMLLDCIMDAVAMAKSMDAGAAAAALDDDDDDTTLTEAVLFRLWRTDAMGDECTDADWEDEAEAEAAAASSSSNWRASCNRASKAW